MKEATGELNMTVITVVAIAAIAAFFYIFVWPGIRVSIAKNNCTAECGSDTKNWGMIPDKDNTKSGATNPFVCSCQTAP